MARPIEPTPVLSGEDKERFIKETENLSYSAKKEKFLKDCDEAFQAVKKE